MDANNNKASNSEVLHHTDLKRSFVFEIWHIADQLNKWGTYIASFLPTPKLLRPSCGLPKELSQVELLSFIIIFLEDPKPQMVTTHR